MFSRLIGTSHVRAVACTFALAATAALCGTRTNAYGQAADTHDSAKDAAQQQPQTPANKPPAPVANQAVLKAQPTLQPAQPGAGQPMVQPPHAPAPANLAPELGKELPAFNGAGIVFDTPRFNFGRVMAGGNVTHEYWFTNPGKELLKILAVQPGCGCTTTGAWDREIPPGESGRIPISVSTGKFSGKISKQITVTTNVKETPSVQLSIEGDIWTPVQVTPPTLAFGQITGGDAAAQPKTLEAALVNNMPEPLEIKNVTCANQSIRAEVTPVETGKRYTLKVTALPPFAIGNFFGEVKIHTNSTVMPEVSVMVSGYVSPPVQVIPAMVALRPTTAEAYDTQVYVRSNTGGPMTLSDLKCTDEKLALTPTAQPGNAGYVVKISVPANYAAPPTGAQITMKTDVKSAETLSVRVFQNAPPTMTPNLAARQPVPAVKAVGDFKTPLPQANLKAPVPTAPPPPPVKD